MEKVSNLKLKKAIRWTGIAVLLMIVSMIGASVVQTSGGGVQIKDLRFETSMGYEMSALLLKPREADSEHKAPAIVTCHGMYNNREMQDSNYVELSRRGFVVLAIDMFSHGNSENLKSEEELPMGVDQAVKMLSSLDYVDTARIGITGHSMGGMNCEVAAMLDNANSPNLISAILFNSCFATYKDSKTGQYANVYGNRDVGIIAGQYDEFLFKDTDKNGNQLLAKDFIKSENAQSFLNFGKAPEGVKEANIMYEESVDGKEAVRVIYNPSITHPWSHFSKRSAAAVIEFFDKALDAPKKISPDQQVWQWKEFFNFIGLAGLAMFVLNFTILLLHTALFSTLRQQETVRPRIVTKQRNLLNYFFGLLCVVFGAATYLPITIMAQSSANHKVLFSQNSTFGIALWAAACGIFAFFCMFISCRVKKISLGYELKETGINQGIQQMAKSLLLAIAVVAGAYFWVFFADYFFKTDFRIWVLAVKVFGADKVGTALVPNVFLFFIYFVSSSILINCFSYSGKETDERGRKNCFMQALMLTLPAIILTAAQYLYLGVTGDVLFMEGNAHSYILWLFPMIVLIPVSAVIARRLYQETKNPYLTGMISAMVITLITCSNTVTWI